MHRLVAGFVLLMGVAGFGACSNSKGEVLTAKPRNPALSGRFFATAGPGESQGDLYEMDFPPEHLALYQLTKTGRTFGVDGCQSSLTVDVAGQDVDFQDALRRFESGSVWVIDGAPNRGTLMSVAPDCRVLYLRLDRGTNPPTGHLMVFDPATKQPSELHAVANPQSVLGISDWGPGGRVAVFQGTAATAGHPSLATGIVLIAPDGSKRTISSPVAELGTLQWGASKWLAIGDTAGHRTVFLDPDSGSRTELPGWFPLAWSPDGQRLLVTDTVSRKTVALVDATALSTVQTVGHTKTVAFVDVVWLPENATAGGPPLSPGHRPDEGD